eukprot:1737471-Rhodomonas_salina.2
MPLAGSVKIVSHGPSSWPRGVDHWHPGPGASTLPTPGPLPAQMFGPPSQARVASCTQAGRVGASNSRPGAHAKAG